MTTKELLALGRLLGGYLELFAGCFSYRPSFEHFGSYARGLLSDLPRKSVEPIALACGTAVRTLQGFLRSAVWDHARVRQIYQQRLAALPRMSEPDDLGTIGLIDETSVAKKGAETPGVQRQYCGALGKQENCIVTVHLGLVRGRFQTLVNSDLFLPESWSDDRDRCRRADIPDNVVYRSKWRIALELLDEARGNGLRFETLTFDEYYGGKPGFLEGLDEREQQFVAEVPKSFRVLSKRPRGARPKRGWTGKRVDQLARFSANWHQQPWRKVSLARLTLDDQEWDVRAAQVYLLREGDLTERTDWLIVARNQRTGETKYFISNAPADTPLERLLRIAFSRWNIEHTFRVAKSELGLSHFEGRSYISLIRHLTICELLLGFVAEHTDRLRGEKSGDHPGTNPPRPEPTLPSLAQKPPHHDRPPTHLPCHPRPPTTQPRRKNLTPKIKALS